MSSATTIVWFRHDLRLADHPALAQAVKQGAVVPAFLWTPGEDGRWAPGGASRWWLHHSLAALDADLRDKGSRLVIRASEDSLGSLRDLARETGATAVFWNRRYEPGIIQRDQRIKAALRQEGLTVESFNGGLLHDPARIRTTQGKPFQVFTPFWKKCLAEGLTELPVQSAPRTLVAPDSWPASEALASLRLLPRLDWADAFPVHWEPGEAGAKRRLLQFCRGALADYSEGRNRVDMDGSSRLSPALHFGELSPRQICQAVTRATKGNPQAGSSGRYLAEVGWREFAHHLLFHFPHTPESPLREAFADFPWEPDAEFLKAWQRGRTGVPVVDAAMRDLWATGFMPNRARMIVASFLTKNLLLPWQDGAAWFWDTLVDADLAGNTLGWQWTAGCGADAAPYFRIFNPVSQAQKFDPEGDYIRRWVPEIAQLQTPHLFAPWEAPDDILREAGVTLGQSYPRPLVDLKKSRQRALNAYEKIKRT